MKHLLVLALASVLACVTPPRAPSCPRSVSILFHAEDSFSLTEQLAILAAADDWHSWSRGRIKIWIAWDSSGEPRIGKKSPVDAETEKVDAQISKKYGQPVGVYGWAPGQNVFVVTERVPPDMLRPVFAHELGHAIGLRWPGCDESARDCFHVVGKKSLMSAEIEEGWAFSDEDLALCRASCLCD